MEHEFYKRMWEVQDTFWWYKGMRKFFDMFLQKYVGSHGYEILDIGCGTGSLFPVLRRYGTVYGIDVSDEAVKYAREQGMAKEVVRGNAEALPFSAERFDVVVCSDLLYHVQVKDDIAVLKEIHRVLKQGGVLVIKEAAYDWLRSRMDELGQTKHRFTLGELRQKLSVAHFQVQRITYIMTILFPLAFTARLLEQIVPRTYDASALFRCASIVNTLFTTILLFEVWLLRYVNFPFGLSIIAVARKF
ncbi:MAG: class I SAM-dependent methyltransferase [Patescibacteria group bacterium]